MIYTVNITSMMVLASIYLSVSTSLPSTDTIKPVEWWLLFNLGYPFIVIITNIIDQVICFWLKLIINVNLIQNYVKYANRKKTSPSFTMKNTQDPKPFNVCSVIVIYINPLLYLFITVFYALYVYVSFIDA